MDCNMARAIGDVFDHMPAYDYIGQLTLASAAKEPWTEL